MHEMATTELIHLKHEIKQATSKLSKAELQNFIDNYLSAVLSNPNDPILRAKASIAADIWNRRYQNRD